ncbi:putative membrane protein, partial [Chlamydia psittaci C1/97]
MSVFCLILFLCLSLPLSVCFSVSVRLCPFLSLSLSL